VMAWDQVLGLFGGQGADDIKPEPVDPPWPPGYLVGVALAALLLNVLPLAEETWRCLRQQREA